MLFKPYVAMQTYAPNPDSLNLLARGRSVQSSTRRKTEQLSFKGRILSKSSSIYPPWKQEEGWRRTAVIVHEWIFPVFGCLCDVC